MKTVWLSALAVSLSLVPLQSASSQTPPTVRVENGASQLVVNGKPFLLLGGELGNSSAGTAAQADTILPRLAGLHFNTVLMPVAWNQIEPQEGQFDFSILDHWIEVAQQQHLHLVLLWFGSWKNAFSEYAPAWVLSDAKTAPDEFYILGSGLTVTFLRDPDTDAQMAGIASIEQVEYVNGKWSTARRLNGDQSDQGRALLMAPNEFRIYRVKLYTYAGSD